MKILHTADWQWGAFLGRLPLDALLVAALEQVASILESEAVDVMLVAGDLFAAPAPFEVVSEGAQIIARLFAPFLTRGGVLLAVAGDQDSDAAFSTFAEALAPARDESGGEFLLTTTPQVRRLTDASGVEVQFVLWPYPTPSRFGREADWHPSSLKAAHEELKTLWRQSLEELRTDANTLDPHIPTVLVTHLGLREAVGQGNEAEIESEIVTLAPDARPGGWAYAAWGHDHTSRAWETPDFPAPARGAGSLVPLAGAERDDTKSVILFEINAEGLVGEPRLHPLENPPFLDIGIREPAEIATLAARYPDAEHSLVHYTLRIAHGTHNLSEYLEQIEAVFPLWYRGTVESQNQPPSDEHEGVPTVSELEAGVADRSGAVNAFLREHFHDHPDRDEILELAERLLSQEE